MHNVPVWFRGFNIKLFLFLALGAGGVAGGVFGVRCSADLALTPITEGAPSVPAGSAAPSLETEIRSDGAGARRAPAGRRPPGILRRRASPQLPGRAITGRAPCSPATR